jgi:hypothetical protein
MSDLTLLLKQIELPAKAKDNIAALAFPPLTGVSTDPQTAGVTGEHFEAGNGVSGVSRKGDGCVGIGAKHGVVGKLTGADISGPHRAGVLGIGNGTAPAGRFEGDVEITEKLALGDVLDFRQHVDGLEQRISKLEQQLQVVMGRLDATQPMDAVLSSLSKAPSIQSVGGNNNLEIHGKGFVPNQKVTIRAVAGLTQLNFQATADAQGGINQNIGNLSGLGRLFIAATDGEPSGIDLTGMLWSNTLDL